MSRDSLIVVTPVKCPKCALLNPDNAARCDCGWNFRTNKSDFSYARPSDKNIQAELGLTLEQVGARNVKVGAYIFFAGLIGAVVTITVTNTATNGVLVLIPYGGIVAGVAIFVKGLRQRRRGNSAR
jgi:hypothetical protein